MTFKHHLIWLLLYKFNVFSSGKIIKSQLWKFQVSKSISPFRAANWKTPVSNMGDAIFIAGTVYVYIYLCFLYIYIYIYMDNGTNGKWQQQTSICLLQMEKENRSLFSLVGKRLTVNNVCNFSKPAYLPIFWTIKQNTLSTFKYNIWMDWQKSVLCYNTASLHSTLTCNASPELLRYLCQRSEALLVSYIYIWQW
jgi:hypothetical protein